MPIFNIFRNWFFLLFSQVHSWYFDWLMLISLTDLCPLVWLTLLCILVLSCSLALLFIYYVFCLFYHVELFVCFYFLQLKHIFYSSCYIDWLILRLLGYVMANWIRNSTSNSFSYPISYWGGVPPPYKISKWVYNKYSKILKISLK